VKRISFILRYWLLPFALLLLQLAPAIAEDASGPVRVYLFWASGCPHCEREILFLEQKRKVTPRLEVHAFEITRNAVNRGIYKNVVNSFGIADPAVPLTIIGNQFWVGYSSDTLSGAEMQLRIMTCLASDCPDSVAGLVQSGEHPSSGTRPSGDARSPLPEKMQVPLLGEIALRDLSLPVLAIILGALDGFNPCAMWTLIFLVGLLVGMKDTVRMWSLGAAFIIGSAAVYFVFMAAWLNLLLFFGTLPFIRMVIGLVALAGGAYYLREFVLNKDAVCAVTAPEKRQRVFQRLRSLAQERSFLIALLGILALAFLVNLVELICSAGIPVVYTQILAMHELPKWQYYSYLLLYILAFMADDLLVFFAAMLTLRVSGITTNYSRYSHLIGGVVLLIIGALMLLRPEWLMFGG
jgi:thiol-disulfide isomerase/thioredoxin/cytochrome c biogenesis protein CcdA